MYCVSGNFKAYRKAIEDSATTKNELTTREAYNIAKKFNTTCRNVVGAWQAAYSLSILKAKKK